MANWFSLVAALAYGYLVGAIPTAYLVARWAKRIDIRRYGSGNVGASNVARQLGKKQFVFVAAFDVLAKGTLTVVVARALGQALEYQALAALVAVVGHNWSPFLRLSGGRGLSVAMGSLLVLAWKELLALLVVALIGWLLFRSTALWFGVSLLLLPLWALAFKEPAPIVVLCVSLVLVSFLKRALANPGTLPAGLRWRDVVIPRLLHDRDTYAEGDWVTRKPEKGAAEGDR
ncbi:MAG: glycerol-3-phosphate acyltransferase [Chloroflexi bacterium]|nr:glycerol-3-phosphate acyltransferase [Chloroflexota bacterium]